MSWPKGKPRSEETKKKISEASASSRPDVRAKMSATRKGKNAGVDNHMYGKKHSEETIKKMSETHLGENNIRYGIHLDDETREKISNTLKNKHLHMSENHKEILRKINTGNRYRKGIPHTEETKKLIAVLSSGRKHTPEVLKKMSETHMGKLNHRFGTHPTDETRQKLSDARRGPKNHNYGKHLSDEVKKHISEALVGLLVKERNGMFGRLGELNPRYGKPAAHGRGSYYTCKNGEETWLRASYEPRVATCLDKLNITWQYELKAFPLELNDKKTTYRPDFYLPEYNIWLESKGYWRDRSYRKVKSFCVKYPDETLRILYLKDIKQLESSIENNEIIDFYNIGIDAKTLE